MYYIVFITGVWVRPFGCAIAKGFDYIDLHLYIFGVEQVVPVLVYRYMYIYI